MSDDYSGDDSTSGAIAAGEFVSGTIEEPGDTDWFSISLVAGATYVFDQKGAWSGSGTLGDAFLRLFDSSGVELAFNDDGGMGFDSWINAFTAPYTGSYYLSAETYPFSSTVGTYELTAMQVGGISKPSDQLILDAISLSTLVYRNDFDTSYGDEGGAGLGWRLVSGGELSNTAPTVGEFQSLFLYNSGVGEAFVAQRGNEVALVFRGTENPADFIADVALPATILAYYEQFALWLTDAFLDYAATIPDAQIYLFGHSLGGALAETFISFHDDPNIRAITFGSPGIATGDALLGIADERVTNVEHTDDLVPALPGPVLNPSGTPLQINLPYDLGGYDGLSEHSSLRYLETAEIIANSGLWEFGRTLDTYIGRQFVSDSIDLSSSVNAVFVMGGGYSDWLIGGPGADVLGGGTGNDTLVGNGGSDLLEGGDGNDQLIGGAGGDIFRFRAEAGTLGSTEPDEIADFNQGNTGLFDLGEGDVIDLSPLIAAAGGLEQPESALWRLETVDGYVGSQLLIDPDGYGFVYSWTPIALLAGVDAAQAANIHVFTNAHATIDELQYDTRVLISDSTGAIYSWNVQTRTVTELVDTGLPLTDVAVGPDGSIYAITERNLYQIDLLSGTAVELASLDAVLFPGHSGISQANGLDIDANGHAIVSFADLAFVADLDLGDFSLTRTTLSNALYPGSPGGIWFDRSDPAMNYFVTTTSYTYVEFRPVIGNDWEGLWDSTFNYANNITALVGVPSGASGFSSLGVIGFDADTAYDFGVAVPTLAGEIQQFDLAGAITGASWYSSLIDSYVLGNQDGTSLIGTELADLLSGLGGADILQGLGGNDALYGGAGNDELFGGSGDDLLDGGSGSDEMSGGIGNDHYQVDTSSDVVFEGIGEGIDYVEVSASYYLQSNVEYLVLASGAGDLFGVGNALANLIVGNEASNLLIGGGGNDEIHGGPGVDSLFGESGNDTLHGNSGIDFLVGGVGDDLLDGGSEADALYGEDGNDTLWGGSDFVTDILVGGTGYDVLHGDSGLNDYDLMDGGAGDDAYYVDTGDDLTFESLGGGTDTVFADISNVPNAGVYLWPNVENLVLLGTTAFGVGNELDNVLTGSNSGNWLLGGSGNDALNGKGGNDVLFGEAGADTFIFRHGTGGDVIGDFTHGTDQIDLTGYGFASFAELANGFHQVDSNGAIDLGNGDLIVLLSVSMTGLDAGDFLL